MTLACTLQSAADGTMPLLQCMIGTGTDNGDFFEPQGMMNATGLPKKYSREKKTDAENVKATLWDKSVAACGTDIKIV